MRTHQLSNVPLCQLLRSSTYYPNQLSLSSNKSVTEPEAGKEFEDISKSFSLLESPTKKRHKQVKSKVCVRDEDAGTFFGCCFSFCMFFYTALPILKKCHYWQIMGGLNTEIFYKNAIVNLVWCAISNFGKSKSILYIPAYKKLDFFNKTICFLIHNKVFLID